MSSRPRAVKAHRVRKAQTDSCLKGGKVVRKAVGRVFANQRRFVALPCRCGLWGPHERWEHNDLSASGLEADA